MKLHFGLVNFTCTLIQTHELSNSLVYMIAAY